MRLIMGLADRANPYVEERKPWDLRKDPAQGARAAGRLHRRAQPVPADRRVPVARAAAAGASKRASCLNDPITQLGPIADAARRHAGRQIHAHAPPRRRKGRARHDRRKQTAVARGEVASATVPQRRQPSTQWNDSGDALAAEPLAPECTIDDFAKVDLRVARVIAAEDVPDAKKLLKLTLSLGGGTTKNVFAGIKEAYKPEDLVGQLVVCVANLAPRKMKFGMSEGMVTRRRPRRRSEVFVITVDEGAVPGQRVH